MLFSLPLADVGQSNTTNIGNTLFFYFTVLNAEDVPLKLDENVDNVEVVKAPEAVSNAKEYPRENLETLRTLGNGTYGNVFLAKAADINESESSSIVVVQSLTSTDEAAKKDFLRRMEMLSLQHENIAKLLGVCREEDPMYAISEYPEQVSKTITFATQ